MTRQWEEAEMLVLLQVMFTDLDFLTALHIELDVLQNFLFEVYCHYNSIPFHNFRHCFCVTQMVRTGCILTQRLCNRVSVKWGRRFRRLSSWSADVRADLADGPQE